MSNERPKFIPSYFDLLRRESEITGARALIPYYLLICGIIGGVAAYVMPVKFWQDAHWDVSTAVYAGLMTFTGLILALGWNAFSRIYELLFRGDFGAYLQEKKILNDYLVHISFMHAMQIAAVVFCGVGLVTVLFETLPNWIDRTLFGASFGFTLYGLKQAVDAISAMNDLAWHSATFERDRVRNGQSNVVNAFGKNGG